MVFTFYLSDLLIGIEFVTGVAFKTHLSNTNSIDFLFDHLVKHICFNPNNYVYRIEACFSNLTSFMFFVKPLYQNVRIDHRITFIFW